jgi:hypothetical protein
MGRQLTCAAIFEAVAGEPPRIKIGGVRAILARLHRYGFVNRKRRNAFSPYRYIIVPKGILRLRLREDDIRVEAVGGNAGQGSLTIGSNAVAEEEPVE